MGLFDRGEARLVAMVDERQNGFRHPLTGVPVISHEERLRDYGDAEVMIGIGNPAAILRIGRALQSEGARFLRLHGNPELLAPGVRLGEGVLIAPYTRIGAGAVIGDFAQVLSTLVSHDVTVGAGSILNYHSSILGHVDIGEAANIAPHAVIGNGRPGERLRIGAGATVAVGAVVSRSVADGQAVVGNPAMSVEAWRRIKALAERTDEVSSAGGK